MGIPTSESSRPKAYFVSVAVFTLVDSMLRLFSSFAPVYVPPKLLSNDKFMKAVSAGSSFGDSLLKLLSAFYWRQPLATLSLASE